MQIKEGLFNRNSEQEFSKKLLALSDAGAGVIQVRTNELMRTLIACRVAVLGEEWAYHEWNIERGTTEYTPVNLYEVTKAGDNNNVFPDVLKGVIGRIEDLSKSEKMQFFVFASPTPWLEAPVVAYLIQQAAFVLPGTNIRIVLVTNDKPLPDCLGDSIATLRLDPPGYGELTKYAEEILSGIDGNTHIEGKEDEDHIRALCYAGSGMSKENFEMQLSLAVVESPNGREEEPITMEEIVTQVNTGKTDIVNKNDILELYPKEDMSNVGGMENLKKWVAQRSSCYTDEAADFGIEPPKGIVAVGPPGTGKSLVAKAVANELGVPLVRLDFGRVFNSLVGQSEERIRTALRMVEFMAPVVLFADEIDKGLGGIGSGGDSGTSHRVLGTFLTWLQDCEAPVFTMVTANNVTGLPPELLRRGRFDAIFSTGLPTASERLEVLKIHMDKRGWDPANYKEKDLNLVVEASKSYVPAEIESAVKDALVAAYSAGEELEHTHIIEALEAMVPLSRAFNTQIQEMVLWAQNNATPAGTVHSEEEDDKVAKIGSRKTRKRNTEH